MSGTPSFIAQEWSVHAQLTISHRRPDATPLATARDDNGVQMEYSWNTTPGPTTANAASTPRPCYGFQRGNITFTTRPAGMSSNQGLQDSGYNSEILSPGNYGSLPTRKTTQQPYNRRCRSTCSITLSEVRDDNVEDNTHTSVTRTQSLNRSGAAEEGTMATQCAYGIEAMNDLNRPPLKKEISRVDEVCEVCGGERSPTALRRAANYTTHFCTRLPDKIRASQDAASQTSDVAAPVTEERRPKSIVAPHGTAHKAAYNTRRKTDSDLLQIPVLDLPQASDNAAKDKPGKRLSRSPARVTGKSPFLRRSSSRSPPRVTAKTPPPRQSTSRSPDSTRRASPAAVPHKPRTVHIDVYCTGSDASDSSSTSSSSDSSCDSDTATTWTSPQTVFESEQLRVVHTRAGKDRLPLALQRDLAPRKDPLSKTSKVTTRPNETTLYHKNNGGTVLPPCSTTDRGKSESFKHPAGKDEKISRGYDSDDGLSCQYPSRFSSYTSMHESSVTSCDLSSSTISCSSSGYTDEYDSAAPTSCKDTATDLDSLSVAQSSLSLAPSDSFEYEDSADRLRIKERERAWATREEDESSKTWRSPQSERRHMLQQQKFREFLAKHLGKGAFPLWRAEKTDDDDDDDDGDETGDAWSFGGESMSKLNTLKREDTVRRATPVNHTGTVTAEDNTVTALPTIARDVTTSHLSSTTQDAAPDVVEHHPLPFSSRTMSPSPTKMQSSITSPFSPRIGVRTDQLSKAERFGTIVGAFRKPGHHVGPAKNPECSCAHCRNYCEQIGYRSRTRSLDMSVESADNWKVQLQEQIARKNVANNKPTVKTNGANSEGRRNCAVYEDEWDDSTAV